jgi:histidine ammonia-lyase
LHEKQIELKKVMIYGVTTGFGAFKQDYFKSEEDALKLQKNLVLSHVCGVGPYFDDETVRAVMLLRAHNLAAGYSGVRPELADRLVEFLNCGLIPLIPEQGSVGASGDLAPLAHLALALIGEEVSAASGKMKTLSYNGKEYSSLKEVKRKNPKHAGLRKLSDKYDLYFKEGLALLNGTEVMTAAAVLAYQDAWHLLDWADAVGAMTLESILGSSRAFDKVVFSVYRHKGASQSAENVRRLITGSRLVNKSERVHDPYSVRCIPQVHGTVRDALNYIGRILQEHFNSIQDDPILFSEIEVKKTPPSDGWGERLHFEHGHFHGEPVAVAMDLLAIVMSELGAISERRIQMLLDPHHNQGLPAALVDNPDGLNSGYMLAQYTAAALASENKTLSHPASVDSIPTSANTEDHVSMGTIAARKARKVVDNVENILAIEALCATEALSFRMGWQRITETNPITIKKEMMTGDPGTGTGKVYDLLRGKKGIPLLGGEDRVLYPFIQQARDVLKKSSPFSRFR